MKMLFSVLIPAYKPNYLDDAITSVLSQTYNNFELLIVDDCSPYDIKDIVDKYKDERIKYFRNQQNCGAENVVDNWNICLSYAKGDYIICMGDDDILLPSCLEVYLYYIKKYPGIGALHGWTEIINEKSNVIAPTIHRCEYESAISLTWHRLNVYENQFIGDFCFERNWLLKNGGFYKLPMAWGSDDITAIIGATKNGIVNTQKIVFQYRVNSQTITNNGNCVVKMNAIILHYQWIKEFISHRYDIQTDELYRKDLIGTIDHLFDKKKAITIANDLQSKSILRLLLWFSKRRDFSLNIKTILFAVESYFKLIIK